MLVNELIDRTKDVAKTAGCAIHMQAWEVIYYAVGGTSSYPIASAVLRLSLQKTV